MRSLRKAFQDNPFLALPHFLDKALARKFDTLSRGFPGKRVVCGDEAISWWEHAVPQHSSVYRFLTSPEVERLIARLLRRRSIRHKLPPLCWVSRYSVAEYINPHRDRSGTIQLLLCLQAPPRTNGGILCIEHAGKRMEAPLGEGDAIVFQATRLLHYTTPLAPSFSLPRPSRVVAVARFFLDEEDEKASNGRPSARVCDRGLKDRNSWSPRWTEGWHPNSRPRARASSPSPSWSGACARDGLRPSGEERG